MSVPLELREQATEMEIESRYAALKLFGSFILEKYPSIEVVIFVGSVLVDSDPEDTDMIMQVRPEFHLTAEELNGILYTEFIKFKVDEKVKLGTNTDILDIIKDRADFDQNKVYVRANDQYGQLVISRLGTHYMAPQHTDI